MSETGDEDSGSLSKVEEALLVKLFKRKFPHKKPPGVQFRKPGNSAEAARPSSAEDRTCFKCGQKGHLIAQCYSKKTTPEYLKSRAKTYKAALKEHVGHAANTSNQRPGKGMIAEEADESWFFFESDDDSAMIATVLKMNG